MATLTLTGTATDDTIVINATGTDSGTYSINGGAAVAFSGVTRVVVTGEDGNDTLTIVNPDGGLFAPTGGISYDGGGDPADGLEILGGTANDLTYTAGATPDAGTLTIPAPAARKPSTSPALPRSPIRLSRRPSLSTAPPAPMRSPSPTAA